MQQMVCSRCKKNPAVVFITRMEGGNPTPEGLCLQCAKELNIPPFNNDMLSKMGISEEDLGGLSEQLSEMMNQINENGDFSGFGNMMPFMDGSFNLDSNNSNDDEENKEEETSDKTKTKKSKKKKKSSRKSLDSYCTNLTKKALNNELDIIIGRDQEIYRTTQILCRRTKNNPCLIGEPGVGKTAIAEGLALKIANGDVPARLKDKEIHLLDLTALVAGTQFRGQFESRIKSLVDEVKKEGNIILFIDEVHNLVGTGDSEGTMNAANILKPALSRGEIQVIGATTFNEYRKNIEKDAALERRFQPVKIEEPSLADTYKMLMGIKSYYENYHNVQVSDAIVKSSVTLSERYINDRFLPDKAIDLLDEACACANLRNKAGNDLIEKRRLIEKLKEDEEEIQSETDNIDFEELANIRAEILSLENTCKELEGPASDNAVTDDDIATVIQLCTGIPASKVKEGDLARLALLEESLKTKIIGQDNAIYLISSAIRRSRVHISPRRRPASFIFVGPTGVGKTELVKQLALELFDTPETLIRLDMSEYMEKHAVSRIIGSPPGYVGYDEAGQLTEKVRRKPYSIILFDEIEKAHPDVMNILLQILDEGKITDAHGRSVSFENTVIIMTSNAGSDKRDTALGFGKTVSQANQDKVMKALSEFLRPEFIGRVDEVVVFNTLDDKNMQAIAELMLNEFVETLKEKGIKFTYTSDASMKLAEKSIGGVRGARDLRNSIRRDVEDKIATAIINSGSKVISEIELTGEDLNMNIVYA